MVCAKRWSLALFAVMSDRPLSYTELLEQLGAMIAGEPDAVANLANASALLFHGLSGLNWAGFYLLKGGELVLGPFQGKPACIRIKLGKGVCGTAAAQAASVLVPDVHEFPGHIACDSASRSELVVPMVKDGRVVGVLDLDSPLLGRFTEEDRKGCEILVAELMRQLRVDW
jgi:L-methionine (R)-S-oxide reductase